MASKNDCDNSSVQSSHFIFSFPMLKLKRGASREGEGSTPFTLCDGGGTETQKSCGVVYLQGVVVECTAILSTCGKGAPKWPRCCLLARGVRKAQVLASLSVFSGEQSKLMTPLRPDFNAGK